MQRKEIVFLLNPGPEVVVLCVRAKVAHSFYSIIRNDVSPLTFCEVSSISLRYCSGSLQRALLPPDRLERKSGSCGISPKECHTNEIAEFL